MKALVKFGAILLVFCTSLLIFSQEQDTTTLTMDLSSGRPIVHVFINGDGPFKFVFDTAASQTIVSSELAFRLKLPSTGVAMISAPGSGVVMQAPKKNVKELRFGEFKFFDCSVVEINDKTIFNEIKADGVMSIQDFAGYVVSIDYQEKKLLIHKGALPEADDASVVPLLFVEGVPGIEIEANGKKVFCILDTGSPFSIGLPITKSTKDSNQKRGIATSVTGRFPFVETKYDGLIKIGSISLQNPTVQMLRGMPYGNLGSRFYMECIVSFDFESAKVKIVKKTQK